LGNGLAAVMVATSKGVRVLQDFTDDRELLIKMIQAPPGDTATNDVATQLENLRKATDMLAALPQKKALVYLAVGTGTAAAEALIRPAVDAAIRANVALYPVDVRGLVGTIPVSSTTRIAAADLIAVAASDIIAVTVNNHMIDGSYTVKADGTLSIPQLGDIKAAGLTPIELRAVINDRLMQSGILKDPHTDLEVTRTPTAGK
jgi:protein involved in polysaccharide export with SLBB domain